MNNEQLLNVNPEDREAVKAAQRFLKAQGFYAGEIDGRWGDVTTAAINAFRENQAEAARIALEREKVQAAQSEAALKQTEIENDPTWRALPPLVGAGLGMGGQYTIGRGLRSADAAMRESAGRLAQAKNIAPVVAENELARLGRGRMARYAGQFAVPAAAFGAAELTRRYVAPQMDTETSRDWVRRGANFETGVGTGSTLMGIKNLFSGRGSPVDPVDRAMIESRAAIARNPELAAAPVEFAPARPTQPERTVTPKRPALPAPATAAEVAETPALPKPELVGRSHSDRLISAAKAGGGANIKTKKQAAKWLAQNVASLPAKERAAIAAELGVNRGPKFVPRLKDAISKMASKTGRFGIFAPLAGAAVGWEMSGDQAQASTGDAAGGSDLRRKAEGAAIGGGATAGTMYSLRKLAETPVGQMISKGATGLAEVSLPSMIDAMTDYSPEERETGRQFLARNLPEWAQSAPIQAAGAREQMGLTPEQTDAAFEQALAQFEAMHQQPQQPAMSPLERIVSAPTGPAKMIAQNALQGWR